MLTDNGSCYRSREFARMLADADIAHRRTRPYRPQTNGKVERFNLTLKWEWAYARAYDSNESRTESSSGGSTTTTIIDRTWLTRAGHPSRP